MDDRFLKAFEDQAFSWARKFISDADIDFYSLSMGVCITFETYENGEQACQKLLIKGAQDVAWHWSQDSSHAVVTFNLPPPPPIRVVVARFEPIKPPDEAPTPPPAP